MTRRLAGGAALAALLLAAALAAVPSRAQETDVSGRVEGAVELSLRRVAPDRVRVTVSSTVPGTAVSVTRAGRRTRLRAYGEPVTGAAVAVRSRTSRSGVTRQTITFGPQSP